MGKFTMKIREFMQGRNGIDKLTWFLSIVYCILVLCKSIFGRFFLPLYIVLTVVQILFALYIVFRIFSKNIQKRYNENYKFEQVFKAWKPYINHMKLRFKYIRTHRFRTCRKCGEFLRLSKKHGRRQVSCPKCGSSQKFFILF